MRFHETRIAAVTHALPPDRVTSTELEERLAPLYDRFRLRVGRLELMSGIRERLFWPPGTRPSHAAALAGEKAIEASGIARDRIGCLIHASVCRDFLEPATASVVHHELGLSDDCTIFDLSNACLGVANSIVVAAGMIESRQIDVALIVAGEDGRPLVDETIRDLLSDETKNKSDLKRAFASLTIASGAAAVVLHRADAGSDAHANQRLIGGAVLSATEHNALCRGDRPDGAAGLLMSTDSEAMLQAGNELAGRTFERLLTETGWTREMIDRVVTHQVGSAHRRLLFETVGLDPELDYPTVETLGNIGSVSLPLSFSMAVDAGKIEHGHNVALLGIGSGLNCLMLGVTW